MYESLHVALSVQKLQLFTFIIIIIIIIIIIYEAEIP